MELKYLFYASLKPLYLNYVAWMPHGTEGSIFLLCQSCCMKRLDRPTDSDPTYRYVTN